MKLITGSMSALAVTATVFSAASAFAATPFSIATRAYHGQLDGISGYQVLEQDLLSGQVSSADIIRAAGDNPTPQLERDVFGFLKVLSNDD